ncbi:MAG: hypothetical protein H0X46_08915 [Bacteroidetes bacterium]|nr:hypothetical protein [Bacteroidota bacterium]
MEKFKNGIQRILIFEHDENICMDIQSKLENHGYVVHRSQTLLNNNFLDFVPFRNAVLKVLALPNKNMPNLVIVDTDTSNTKELEKLKKQCKKKKLPIIYITSEIDDKIISEREKNAIGIFKKPLNTDTIIELITEYFKNKSI